MEVVRLSTHLISSVPQESINNKETNSMLLINGRSYTLDFVSMKQVCSVERNGSKFITVMNAVHLTVSFQLF